jgi:uncharacterized protein
MTSAFSEKGETMKHLTKLALICLVLFPSSLIAQPGQPSFDCKKASSPTEKAICANDAISRLDLQLHRTWKMLLDNFSLDAAQTAQVRSDQKAWLVHRNDCGADALCIAKLYRDRITILSGDDPAHRFSGGYQVKGIGFIALYPLGSRYLVSIQTADPQDGKWECQLNGEAESSGDDLNINIEGSAFQAHLHDHETIVILNAEGPNAAAQKFCGLNGTFAFTYRRVHPAS